MPGRSWRGRYADRVPWWPGSQPGRRARWAGRWPERLLPWLAAAAALALGVAAIGATLRLRGLERQLEVVGRPLTESWRPPADLPRAGQLSTVDIPGTTSGFSARAARLYLPPAALVRHPPRLPVLLLLPGRPAPPDSSDAPYPPDLPDSPDDWVRNGRIAGYLDAYALAHHGLAPVVVVADPFGAGPDNPLCADSAVGNAASYLTVDVPAWVRAHTPVRSGPWAVGGYASGGTCAVQLAMRAPELFRTFVDLSGQDEPTLGSRELTISQVFAGDAAAYARINPADIVALQRFPQLAGFLAAGRDDVPYNDQTRAMLAVCQRGGIPTQFYPVRGGHDWSAWRDGFSLALPWLGLRLGLT